MRAKPELLFLSHRLPTPPHNGAAIRTFNLLRVLSQSFKVTALCFDRTDPVLARLSLKERIDAMTPYAETKTFAIPQQHSRVRFMADHLRSLVTGKAYTIYSYDSTEYSAAIKEAMRTHDFALAHVDTLDLAGYIDQLGDLPVACTHHNVESQLLRRRATTEPGARKAYLNLQADKLEKLEKHWLPRVALNIAVSDDDARTFRKMDSRANVEVIPNGVDIEYFQPVVGEQTGIVFTGGTNWFPNRDGLEWFHAEILPELRRIGTRDGITWVGRCTGADRTQFGGASGITFTDYVPDVRPYINSGACVIVPLRVGGGTRLKILDAWASGKAIVSTTRGCEGLKTEHGKNILIADEPADFARCVQQVLTDESLRESLGRAARETAVNHYGWQAIGGRLAGFYDDVIARTQRAPAPASRFA